ncbi:ATP-binding cassette domain-containing protein [Paenibacillus sacheonensis]|uniref:ATP-binding cassette domain-containing protein n=1 Tax=Paenibacillus sacheonensis TaxID=742054 RepID=A0A7X4YLW1_9BACL|nr:ATP-binding cassette domain-containing protein [Paenibacillus sacheonensis]MBM7565918.1 ABC-2 type transport system ATP-binding protein [Paenibacillus sacheonensis]NBC68767.1 ATP-binding cassette domain-containing protein [Paenibacillus sacheonensis]
MNEYVLRTQQLTKRYKTQSALDRVDMTVRKGTIYGFIGQNGAGKSTLMKLVTGLAFPTSGSIELFGATGGAELNLARKRMGVAIENPALYPQLTAAENLEAHRLQQGIPGKESLKRTLDLIGLSGTGRKKTKNFSLGMKQRLALGVALLGEPEFLILDEPTNGLDPMGVVEMRELLTRLNREMGITILISSHILSELHLLATHYGIIHKGKLLEELTSRELQERCRQFIHIKVNVPERAAAVLERELATTEFEVTADGVIRLYAHLDRPADVSSALVAGGLALEQFMPMGEDLESYFASRIGGGEHA